MDQQAVLRPATENDTELYFEWANDMEVRANAFNSEPIVFYDHKKWFSAKLKSNDCYLFVLEGKTGSVGQIRFDKDQDIWMIDYSIASEYRGQGFGKTIVEFGIKRLIELKGQCKIGALVKDSNPASLKVFRKLGFDEFVKDKIYSFQYV